VVVVSLERVAISPLSPSLLRHDIGDERLGRLHASAAKLGTALGASMVLNVNSTATGGGVAEMLHTLLGYARGAGLDVRWMVLDAPPEFFVLTKRLHHMLHGVDPGGAIDRVQLACLAIQDVDENGLLVNALQRAATVVVQKSLAEGFGLTATEAMWKSKPVVASRVCTSAQIVSGETGWLIDDPGDAGAFAAAVCSLLEDPILAGQLGDRARASVAEHFLPDRHLTQWSELLQRLLEPSVPAV
jgi:glycosyltransferase involved in cell wall biosynthesis